MSLSTPAASLTFNAPWKFRYASEVLESGRAGEGQAGAEGGEYACGRRREAGDGR